VTPLNVVLVAVLASAQAQPDFSGRWTLDAPSQAPPDAARVLVIEQPVMRMNDRGDSIPPMYVRVSVRREGPSGTTTDTYAIGTMGGVVGGVDRNGKRIGPSARFEVAWRRDTLTFQTRRDGPDAGVWSERSESWSLDPDGRLRVEIKTEAHDLAQQTTVLFYRRSDHDAVTSPRSRA
jgi:hypothetical protein